MEGDAGASRLNPTGREPDTSDESDAQSDPSQDQPADATAQDGQAEQVVEHDPEVVIDQDADQAVAGGDDVPRREERFGRGWLVAICLALLVLTAGVGVGGYLALKSHDKTCCGTGRRSARSSTRTS